MWKKETSDFYKDKKNRDAFQQNVKLLTFEGFTLMMHDEEEDGCCLRQSKEPFRPSTAEETQNDVKSSVTFNNQMH